MNTERRDHHRRDYGKVQKHDDRLTLGVLPKALLAREPTANEQSYSHRDFQEKN